MPEKKPEPRSIIPQGRDEIVTQRFAFAVQKASTEMTGHKNYQVWMTRDAEGKALITLLQSGAERRDGGGPICLMCGSMITGLNRDLARFAESVLSEYLDSLERGEFERSNDHG